MGDTRSWPLLLPLGFALLVGLYYLASGVAGLVRPEGWPSHGGSPAVALAIGLLATVGSLISVTTRGVTTVERIGDRLRLQASWRLGRWPVRKAAPQERPAAAIEVVTLRTHRQMPGEPVQRGRARVRFRVCVETARERLTVLESRQLLRAQQAAEQLGRFLAVPVREETDSPATTRSR